MREKELEARQMEMAKILSALNAQREKLQLIHKAKQENIASLETLSTAEELDVNLVQMHQGYEIKLNNDIVNQERIIANTESILKIKQKEVHEAHKKVESNVVI